MYLPALHKPRWHESNWACSRVFIFLFYFLPLSSFHLTLLWDHTVCVCPSVSVFVCDRPIRFSMHVFFSNQRSPSSFHIFMCFCSFLLSPFHPFPLYHAISFIHYHNSHLYAITLLSVLSAKKAFFTHVARTKQKDERGAKNQELFQYSDKLQAEA